MPEIIIKDLYFFYHQDKPVLQGINLFFDRKSVALIGQNGSGKSTLARLLKGLLRPASGTILINGCDTSRLSVGELAKTIGLVFQNPGEQIFQNTVLAEVMFGPLNIEVPGLKARENSHKALEMVGLAGYLEAHPYDLSLAERKLLCIASVLAMEPDILIMDEPTIAQDFRGKERIKGLISSLKDSGKLILTISHDMDFIAETCERVVVLQKGRILADGDVRDIFSRQETLRNAYLEPPQVTQLGLRLGDPEIYLTAAEFINAKKQSSR